MNKLSIRKPFWLFALVIVTFPILSFAPYGTTGLNSIESLKWLIGTWENTSIKNYYTRWEMVGDTLKGTEYEQKKNKEVVRRNIHITLADGIVYYHSQSTRKKTEPELLTLESSIGDTFRFKDTDEKFPVTITITRLNSKEIVWEWEVYFGNDFVGTSTSRLKRVQ